MRLQLSPGQAPGRFLALPCAVLVAWSGPATAGEPGQVVADLRAASYQDNDRTSVNTATLNITGQATQHVAASARYLIDAISSASVDVVSAATTRFRENRHEGEGTLGWSDGTTSLSAGYVRSVENDWASHNGSLGASRDLRDHTLTLAAGLTATRNDVGRHNDPHFHRTLDVLGGSASVTQALSRVSLGQLTFAVSHLDGYQASPYRFVAVDDAGTHLPEAVPDRRLRLALAGRYHRHLGFDSALQTHLRGYADDWGIRSVTGGAEALLGFGEATLGLRARGYVQQAATFYRERYAAPMRYLTVDRELGTFVDVFAGPRLQWLRRRPRATFAEIRAEAKVDAFVFRYLDFAFLRTRVGATAELAFGVTL